MLETFIAEDLLTKSQTERLIVAMFESDLDPELRPRALRTGFPECGKLALANAPNGSLAWVDPAR